MDALRDTMKGLMRGTVNTRARGDLGPGILMATSGRHCIFFKSDDARVLVFRVLHDSMDFQRHLDPPAAPDQDA